MANDNDKQIIDLCAKVIHTEESSEFEVAAKELREALHDRISSTRRKLTELVQRVGILNT